MIGSQLRAHAPTRPGSSRGAVPNPRGPAVMAIEQTAAGGSGTEISTLRMVIGGETVDALDGQTFEVVNPATGASIATAPLGGKADVDKAVEAARKAFEDPKGWASWPAGKR